MPLPRPITTSLHVMLKTASVPGGIGSSTSFLPFDMAISFTVPLVIKENNVLLFDSISHDVALASLQLCLCVVFVPLMFLVGVGCWVGWIVD